MSAPTIVLSAEETALLDQVMERGEEHGLAGIQARRSGAILMRSLLDRSAIPEARLRYFTDPELNIGSSVSRQEVFVRNGTKGNAIFEHPHFLPHLRYFVFGPNLPPDVSDAFRQAVGKVEYLSSSDLPEIAANVRKLVRIYEFEPANAAEEFFKLAIEIGLDPFHARYFRDAARKVRR